MADMTPADFAAINGNDSFGGNGGMLLQHQDSDAPG